jgi:hypothetical protein
MLKALRWLALAVFCLGPASVHATIVLDGLEFTIAGGGNCDLTSCPDVGDHFHSDVYFGRQAEVGGYAASSPGLPAVEEIRGMAEFDLTGLSHVSSATLTFSVYRQGGMFDNTNDAPFTGTILVDAYEGNNSIGGNGSDVDENFELLWTDYEEASIFGIGEFDVVGGGTSSPDVGTIISFNITGLFNMAIGQDLTSLGIRLRQDRADDDYGLSLAWTFADFQITATQVPEPGTVALLGIGLAGLVFSRRKALVSFPIL